ncbi:jg5421 [Pararge aegeria aegeria]|uniref:Jg5421 protein n=1 Tax=Pararge aegeria aegeria TaxID=348720 RepID=A0A8S4SEF0_9NEOP|nr:jg5421 [Pararge aegeria aegeria]
MTLKLCAQKSTALQDAPERAQRASFGGDAYKEQKNFTNNSAKMTSIRDKNKMAAACPVIIKEASAKWSPYRPMVL